MLKRKSRKDGAMKKLMFPTKGVEGLEVARISRRRKKNEMEDSIDSQIKHARLLCKSNLIGALIILVMMIFALISFSIHGLERLDSFNTLMATMLACVAFLCAIAGIYYTDLQILKLKKALEKKE